MISGGKVSYLGKTMSIVRTVERLFLSACLAGVFGTASATVEGIPGGAGQDVARSADQGIRRGVGRGITRSVDQDIAADLSPQTIQHRQRYLQCCQIYPCQRCPR